MTAPGALMAMPAWSPKVSGFRLLGFRILGFWVWVLGVRGYKGLRFRFRVLGFWGLGFWVFGFGI